MGDKRVSCSFCNEECPASAIGEHLMTCGNKTDQCPNCKKYVRRAIFAYHYENNCANLDESEPAGSAVANRPQTFSTFQPGNAASSLSRSPVENNKQISVWNIDLPTDSKPQITSSQQPDSEGRVTYIVCRYCNHDCDPHESDIHQQNCLRNPKNIEKRQRSQNNPTYNQNTVQLNHVDQSNDNADIPCQYCNKPIKLSDYHNHTQACVAQHYPPTLQQPQPIDRAGDPASARCKYCKQYMIAFVEQHERICQQNPLNIALEEEHRSVYYLLPLACMPYP